jgi:pimeloyl-ACP methyl ester carboxylesterase
MNLFMKIATALLMLGGLSACSTPIGVREVNHGSVRQMLTANAISADEPSIASRQVMLRLGLGDDYRRNPESTLERLHDLTMQEMASDRLFALSEFSYLHATTLYRACKNVNRGSRRRRTYQARNAPPLPECERARSYFVAASIYAYAFLFPEDANRRPSAFNPQLRVAVDIYNLAITSAISPQQGEVATGEFSYSFHLGTLNAVLDPEELQIGDRRLSDLVPAARLAVRGLRNRYRRPGIGAPFVASAVHVEGMSVPIRSARVPDRVSVPVTILVRYENVEAGLRTGSIHGRFEVYTEIESSDIEIAGQRVPLEYETTSALAYGLGRSTMWDFEIAGFRSGDFLRTRNQLIPEDGLLMLEPYQPGSIPIVLVHGTASSPARWAEMLNEFQSDPIIRARYQFWFFIYSTGNPILYSASLLRTALSETISELDPEGRDPTLQRMVVIGHSQGGLLARLQVSSSGTRFWDNVSDRPFDELDIEPDTRETLASALFFERQEFIERVIYISTPHRGSFLAGSRLGNFASGLVSTPTYLLGQSVDLARAGVDLVGSAVETSRELFDGISQEDESARLNRRMRRLPNSVDNMRPDSQFTNTLKSIPIDPHVYAHSIIPVLGTPPPEGQDDGVVAYSSAHLEEAQSEFIVFQSGHSTQAHPDTIQETRRILLEHLDAR